MLRIGRVYHSVRAAQMKGLIYVVWGQRAAEQAKRSIASARRWMPGLPALTLGDNKAGKVMAYLSPFESKKFLWGRHIPFLYHESPFRQTLYIDSDTEFVASPEAGFRWLDDWDFVLAETPDRSLASKMVEKPEMEYSRQFLGVPDILYHNGGAFLWSRNRHVETFFDLWHEEWLRFQSWDPQVALLRALARSDMVFLTLPHTWNCKTRQEATFIYHPYGSHSAQTFWAGKQL